MIDIIVDFSKQEEKKKFFEILRKIKQVPQRIQIKQFRKKRSGKQNGYYFGVVLETLSRETGFMPDEMHQVLKLKFNPEMKVLKQTGEQMVIGKSTAELDTFEMEEFLEKVRIWAMQDLEIYIPLPNEIMDI